VKVLTLLGYYEPGGFKTVIDNLSKSLRRLGVEVTVAARVVRTEPPSYVNLIRLRLEELPEEGRHYDVIHIHTSYPYTKVAVEHGMQNVTFTWHGYAPTVYVPGLQNKIVNLALRYAYRKLLPRLRFITAVSDYANRQLQRLFGVSGEIVSNGVDAELFRPCPRDIRGFDPTNRPVILNLTAYNNLKGKDILIRAFKAIRRRYGRAVLLVRGSVPQLNGVVHLRYVPYERLPEVYCRADFYLLTSRWESFGLPILESFATGTPVIAYDRDDARREHILGSSGGLLFRDDKTLLQAVEEILSNWAVYSQRAANYAINFGWDNVAREYLNVYRKVVGERT